MLARALVISLDMHTIALLTDFGDSEYVGIMKGVIAMNANVPVNVIDITHNIKCQCVLQASWVLSTAIPYFPQDTVFVCVVDPGVGGERAGVIIETRTVTLIGPNNGIFTHALRMHGLEIVRIRELSTCGASHTFHGRDVFAVAAAKYVSCEEVSCTGGSVEAVVLGDTHGLVIVSIDHFGNLITDKSIEVKEVHRVIVRGKEYPAMYVSTYEEGEKKGSEVVVLKGSNDTIEVSVVKGSAASLMGCQIGDEIKID